MEILRYLVRVSKNWRRSKKGRRCPRNLAGQYQRLCSRQSTRSQTDDPSRSFWHDGSLNCRQRLMSTCWILCRGETLLRSRTKNCLCGHDPPLNFHHGSFDVALPGTALVASLLSIILDQPLHLSIYRLPDEAVRDLSPIHHQRSSKFACDRLQQC